MDTSNGNADMTNINKSDAAMEMRLADSGQAQFEGWQVAWAQLIGLHHPRLTEDSVATRAVAVPGNSVAALCVAVADGVGGGARGEVASQALASYSINVPDACLSEQDGLSSRLKQWMRGADAEVQAKLREVTFSPGAATLAAAWLLPDGTGHLLRIGDARLYRFDGQAMHALTADQTYVEVGEEPPPGAEPGDPARMVGTGFMGEPEVRPLQLGTHELLLLCSDGLHRGLDASRMADGLQASGSLLERALGLAQAAQQAGSDDDITVMLIQPTKLEIVSNHKSEHVLLRILRRLFRRDRQTVKATREGS